MNHIDNISKILNYINESPDKDKVLDDLRMTDTNEFQHTLNSIDNLIDNNDGDYIHQDDIESSGYISEYNYDDKLREIRKELNNLVDTVNDTTMLEVAKHEILKEIENIKEML